MAASFSLARLARVSQAGRRSGDDGAGDRQLGKERTKTKSKRIVGSLARTTWMDGWTEEDDLLDAGAFEEKAYC